MNEYHTEGRVGLHSGALMCPSPMVGIVENRNVEQDAEYLSGSKPVVSGHRIMSDECWMQSLQLEEFGADNC